MKNIKQISLILLILLSHYSFVNAEGESYPCTWDETEECRDPTPPPKNALELKQRVFKNQNDNEVEIPYTQHRPENWPVRVFYTGNDNVYEFDKKGNILIAKGKPAKGYMVETYKGDKPAWKGDGHVYYWHNPDSSNPDPDLMMVLANNKACPAMSVADEYSFIKRNQEDYALYLDGDCGESYKVKRGKSLLWGYPSFKQNKADYVYNYYWQVQYFDDPISPIYNLKGKCIYYCDAEK